MNIFRLLILSILTFLNIYSFTSYDVQVTIFVHGTKTLSKLFLCYFDAISRRIQEAFKLLLASR